MSTDRYPAARIGAATVLTLALLATACAPPAGDTTTGAPDRRSLTVGELLGDKPVELPVPTSAFEPGDPGDGQNHFEGQLTIGIDQAPGQLEVISDIFELAIEPNLQLDVFPEIAFDLVQSGNDLVPVHRGRQRLHHPHWEIVLEPGKVWNEPGDAGWSRASMPFALLERNANCTHNGLLTFLFRNDGELSKAVFQVGSETCHYLQFNYWGTLRGSYQPRPVPGRNEIVRDFQQEQAARLPTRPLSQLTDVFPEADVGQFALHDPEEVSTFGFVIDGVHYSGGCPTRFGPYPYCENLDLPSYSLAKSIFAGSVFMQLERLFPGVGNLNVTDYVPECRQVGRWDGVTLGHLLDMSSGNYQSLTDQEDEFFSYSSELFDREDHAGKITDACGLFPRRSEPGSTWVYHTSETYIAGALMNAYLREQMGDTSDIYTDLMTGNILRPLRFSLTIQDTIRSYDDAAQPFTGYGLTMLPDDIARFGLFLLQSEGKVQGEQLLDEALLAATLQRDPADPGMPVQADELRYNNGMWAARIPAEPDCGNPVWIPFMSGYGGISVVLMPNDSVYYVFSDGAHFRWAPAARESARLKSFCGNPQP